MKNFFKDIVFAYSRQDQIQRLTKLTDTELATKYGIERDQIVAYVFRDKII